MQSNLTEHATVDLTATTTVEEIAKREGWTPDDFALNLAHCIRADNIPLDAQRQRLAALANLAPEIGSKASADELARHYVVLNALFDRLAWAAAKTAESGKVQHATAVERLATGAVKTQRAALGVLSALKALRDDAGGMPPGHDNDNDEVEPNLLG